MGCEWDGLGIISAGHGLMGHGLGLDRPDTPENNWAEHGLFSELAAVHMGCAGLEPDMRWAAHGLG